MDPNRPSRKFSKPKSADEINADEKKNEHFSNLETVPEDIDLAKKKAQRLEAAKLLEEQLVSNTEYIVIGNPFDQINFLYYISF